MKPNLATPTFQTECGQGMTEYLIIVALIAITGIAVYSFFGQTLRHQMAGISQELSGKKSRLRDWISPRYRRRGDKQRGQAEEHE